MTKRVNNEQQYSPWDANLFSQFSWNLGKRRNQIKTTQRCLEVRQVSREERAEEAENLLTFCRMEQQRNSHKCREREEQQYVEREWKFRKRK